MCRYMMGRNDYKSSFVCTDCRKVWQYHIICDGDIEVHRCPDCNQKLIHAGRDFKAPRKRDKRRWETVRLTLAAGVNYDSCGCTGPGPRPHNPREARELLQSKRVNYALRKRRP